MLRCDVAQDATPSDEEIGFQVQLLEHSNGFLVIDILLISRS